MILEMSMAGEVPDSEFQRNVENVCHEFRLKEDAFLSHFRPLVKTVSFFKLVGTVVKIKLSLKTKYHDQVFNNCCRV